MLSIAEAIRKDSGAMEPDCGSSLLVIKPRTSLLLTGGQEASYSDFPAVAVGNLYQHLRIDCPDHRFIVPRKGWQTRRAVVGTYRRRSASHAGGPGFESLRAHHFSTTCSTRWSMLVSSSVKTPSDYEGNSISNQPIRHCFDGQPTPVHVRMRIVHCHPNIPVPHLSLTVR